MAHDRTTGGWGCLRADVSSVARLLAVLQEHPPMSPDARRPPHLIVLFACLLCVTPVALGEQTQVVLADDPKVF